MKIFITGATGQVGYHLVEYLVKENPLKLKSPKDIICLVRNPAKTKELQKFGVSYVKGTLEDRQVMYETMQDPEMGLVIHNAANIDTSSNYRAFYVPNVIGTRYMLEAFAASSAKTFVFASSIAVYDTFLTKNQLTIVDEKTPIGPLKGEGYSVTKRKCEILVQDYVKKYSNKRFVITRLGPIVGKKDSQIIPNFVKLLSFRAVPKMIANGRDFFSITSPRDIARAQIFLATVPNLKSGEAFNVVGRNLTYRQIYDQICDFYHFPPPHFSIPIEFFDLIRPMLPLAKKLFHRVQFFKQAFSESALGYIGKTFIYRTSKLERLGFKFEILPNQSIQEALEYMAKIPEWSKYNMQPYIYEFSKTIVTNTAVDLRDAFELFAIARVKKHEEIVRRVKILLRFLLVLLIFTGLIVLSNINH